MLRYRILGSLWVLTASCLTLAGADSSSSPLGSSAFYSHKQPSRDGIGRLYMGREISFVMGHRGVDWLERRGREKEERTDLVIAGMQLEPDAVVADLGAGSGHFAFRISPRVPQGRVLAVDIQPEMLAAIEKRKRQGSFQNVETVLGTETDPNLPAGGVDAWLRDNLSSLDELERYYRLRHWEVALTPRALEGERVVKEVEGVRIYEIGVGE